MQEPFRWQGNVATIEAFESGALDMKDFYFTGDEYRYHIEIDAKRHFLELLKDRFNSGVRYNGRILRWDTVIEQKTMELARYVIGKLRLLDFSGPKQELERTGGLEVRKRILSLSQSDARRLGIGKSTLHHLRSKANNGRPFRLYRKIQERLL